MYFKTSFKEVQIKLNKCKSGNFGKIVVIRVLVLMVCRVGVGVSSRCVCVLFFLRGTWYKFSRICVGRKGQDFPFVHVVCLIIVILCNKLSRNRVSRIRIILNI